MTAPARHLAVLKPEFIALIAEGRKTVESRLSITRRAPFGVVNVGDVVLLKPVGGAVRLRARVAQVQQYSRLSPAGVRRLRAAFNDRVCAPDAYWLARAQARYATFIWLDDVREVKPAWRPARLHGRGWAVLTSPGRGGSAGPRSRQAAAR